MLVQETGQVAAADFFLAFDDQVKIDWQFTLFGNRFCNSKNVAEDLSLIVGRTPGKNVTVFQNRIERRRFPEFERIGRLDVVVAVNHYGPATGLMFVLCPDDWMPGR